MNNNDDKFIIRAKKNYGETSVVSCRMPNDVRLDIIIEVRFKYELYII